jgi:hypothetical protein
MALLIKFKTTAVVLAAIVLCTSAPSQQSSHTQKLPLLKLTHEDFHNPIAFVVPIDTSEGELAQLVLQIRSIVQAHQFGVLGLPFGRVEARYDVSGMIEVFRGRKCIAETYTEGRLPCGEGDHFDVYYQWGLGGLPLDAPARFACDSGGYRKRDGTVVYLFQEKNGCR